MTKSSVSLDVQPLLRVKKKTKNESPQTDGLNKKKRKIKLSEFKLFPCEKKKSFLFVSFFFS